ncbi:MAG: metallophosphoesterase [Candidatus Micrarchaeaceae archaeon]
MRIILFSDLHIKESNLYFLPILQDEINKLNGDMLIFLGDLFNSVVNPPIVLNTAKSFLNGINVNKIILISGNHDQTSSDGVNQIINIFNGGNITTVNLGTYLKIGNIGFLFLSYSTKQNMSQYISDIQDRIPKITNLCFMHQSLYLKNDPKLNNFGGLTYDDNLQFWRSFKKIYLGHIHELYDYANVSYIGSTTINGFNDKMIYNSSEGFIPRKYNLRVLDIENTEIKETIISKDFDTQYLVLDADKYATDAIYKQHVDNAMSKYKINLQVQYSNQIANIENEIKAITTNSNVISTRLKKENKNMIQMKKLSLYNPKDFLISYINSSNIGNKDKVLKAISSLI